MWISLFRYFTEVDSCIIPLSVTGSVLEVHVCCPILQSALSQGYIVFHGVHVPHFLYPSTHQRTFRLGIWATVNSATSDMGMQVSLEVPISALLDKYPKVRLQGHMVFLILVF